MNQLSNPFTVRSLKIMSNAFVSGGLLPTVFRHDGLNVNPLLRIQYLPHDCRSLAVVMKDADAPVAPRIHWICWDLPPSGWIHLNEMRGVNGLNDFQLPAYTGPCVCNSRHKYFFEVYALDKKLHLPKASPYFKFYKLMPEHLLAAGSILFFSSFGA
jgi:Raf kinase inhibitor-like YbhB/YbcL family protein